MSGQDGQKQAGEERAATGMLVLLGTNVAVGVAVFTLAGYYIDYRRGGGQSFTIAGGCLGLIYAFYEIWKTIAWASHRDRSAAAGNDKKQDKSNP